MSKNLDLLMSFMRQLAKSHMPEEGIGSWGYNYALMLCRADEELKRLPDMELPALLQIQVMDHAADLLKFATEKLHRPQIAETEATLDRIIPMMDKIDHLSGERALGREKALTQLCCVIAQIKEDLQTDMEVPCD